MDTVQIRFLLQYDTYNDDDNVINIFNYVHTKLGMAINLCMLNHNL